MNNTSSVLFQEENVYSDRVFTRKQVEDLLSAVRGKTLHEADVNGVLDEAVRVRPDKVVRGIAGDVIEVSVLGCQRDSRPEPDIWVDNIKTELKTTGLVKPKNDSKREYEAKDPTDYSKLYYRMSYLLILGQHEIRPRLQIALLLETLP